MSRTIHLGPKTPQWRPGSWDDLLQAVTGGLLDESHWVELKREIPTTKSSNVELGRDLASMAPDGGVLIIGVDEDDVGRAQSVVGTDLRGLAERVEAVAGTRIDPPLVLRTHAIEDPQRPGVGCLLVEVPPSSRAPHMVEHIYYGRGDKTKIRLSDPQVREIVERLQRGRADLSALLDDLAEHDPVDEPQRANAHLYLIAHPVAARDDALADLVARHANQLTEAVARAKVARPAAGADFSPDLGGSWWVRRAVGLASMSGINEARREVRENGLLELTVQENGAVTVLCGRASSNMTSPWIEAEGRPEFQVVIPALVLGLVHSTLTLAADLAERHGGYLGQWQIGLRITGLRGSYAPEYVRAGDIDQVRAYDRDIYERIATASTMELADTAHRLTERLVGPLLRSLSIDRQYLPYGQEAKAV